MKKILSILLTSLIIYSCNQEDKNITQTTIKAEIEFKAPDYFLDCIKKRPEQNKLNYPNDITITRDGKTVYVLGKPCYEGCNILSNDYEYYNENNYVYKIEDGKLRLLKINGHPISCVDTLDIDSKGNLYVLSYNTLYKISEQKQEITKLHDFTKDIYGYSKTKNEYYSNISKIISIFISNQDEVFVRYPRRTEYVFAKLNKNNILDTLYKQSPYEVDDTIDPFVEKDGKFYSFSGTSNEISVITIDYINNTFDKKVIAGSLDPPAIYYFPLKKYSFKSKFNKDGILYYLTTGAITRFDIIDKKDIDFRLLSEKSSKDAYFYNPESFDIDDNNNIYVTYTGNKAIRKITHDGIVSTIYKE